MTLAACGCQLPNPGWTLTLAPWIFLIAVGAAAEPMGPPPPPEKWSADEVEAGRAECGKRLSGLHVQFEALGPIKDGMCGTPAPIRLKGFEQGAGSRLRSSPRR